MHYEISNKEGITMGFKHITVAGSGVLGSQIAYQTAYSGFQVSVYDISEGSTRNSKR